MKITSIVSLLLLGFCVNAEAQTTPAPQVLRYQNNKISWEIDAASLLQAQGYVYKLYGGTSSPNSARTITDVVCTGTASPFKCEAPALEFTVGSNILEATATSGTGVESTRSTALLLFYATTVKETIINTDMQSVLRCQPGTFEMLRITDATKMQAALNASTKHVAYMFATSNAVYAIFCTLLQSGT